ncbi:MAG: YceI family protein [Gammaproteobacteria bacterium]|nr:MAG: YceI family protein [Gammaproteobacteria bacterium]
MMNYSRFNYFIISVIGLLIQFQLAHASDWEVIKPQSRIGFTAQWEDMPFDGVFHRYSTTIDFDPASPDTGKFAATIFMASADTNDRERDEALQFPEWFNPARFPVAKFTGTTVRAVSANQYELTGKLTIKNITHDVQIPFVWKQGNGQASFSGNTTLDRTLFRVGEGEWLEDQSIHFDVQVHINLQLRKP